MKKIKSVFISISIILIFVIPGCKSKNSMQLKSAKKRTIIEALNCFKGTWDFSDPNKKQQNIDIKLDDDNFNLIVTYNGNKYIGKYTGIVTAKEDKNGRIINIDATDIYPIEKKDRIIGYKMKFEFEKFDNEKVYAVVKKYDKITTLNFKVISDKDLGDLNIFKNLFSKNKNVII